MSTNLNPGVIFEEEQDHALVDSVDVVVHGVVESGREDSGEEPPRAPGEQVDRRSAEHDRGRDAVAQRVGVNDQRQQHGQHGTQTHRKTKKYYSQ